MDRMRTYGRLATIAGLLSCAGAVSAQSGVTVFGVLDVGVQRLQTGSLTQKLLSTDGLQSSRLGFRGVEDLGDGLSAGFHLEGATSPNTGGGYDFRRRSTVSLSSKRVGELRLGRDYTPTFWNITRFNAFGTNGVGAASNLIYGFDGKSSTAPTIVRANNSIGYLLPGNLGGVYGQAMVAAGQGAPGKYIGARLGYAAGPVDVAGSYSTTDNNAAGDKFKVASVGASYDFGAAKLLGLYHVSEQTVRKQTNWVAGVMVPIGLGQVRASFVRSEFSNSATSTNYTGKQMALGYVYNLSKRTALYGTYSRVTNSDTGRFAIQGGTNLAGESSTGVETGLYHTF